MYGLSEESLTIVGIILIIVGVAMIGWGFEGNQDIPMINGSEPLSETLALWFWQPASYL